jgi:hypothetical protein
MFRNSCFSTVFVFILFLFPTLTFADDVIIKEAGLTITLPGVWASKYNQSKIPTGQLLQRWVRDPVVVDQYKASPGLIVVSTAIPKNAELALITQGVLSREPHNVKLGVDTQCIKCVTYKLKAKSGTVTSISPTVPPNCSEYKPGLQADCMYQSQDYLGIKIEPSWANRFEKDALYGKSYVLVIHAIVDEMLVDFTFIYPKNAATQIEPEISSIISSIKKISAVQLVKTDAAR